jgi:hypothetical protein
MEASDQAINFRTVAAEARVSTAWLYGKQELRVRIMRSRRTTNHGVVPLVELPPRLPEAEWGLPDMSRVAV